MKKTALFSMILMLLCNVDLFAQGNEIDAFTLTNTELGGTARSMAMGGAFGALGGDLSVISNNPAGLGIYRSSEVSGTLDFSKINTSTNWIGQSTDKDKARFAPSIFAFSLYFPTGSEGVRNWSFGFSYNRLKDYHRSYKMSNKGQDYSMADFAAWRAMNAFGPGKGISQDELESENPYSNSGLSGNWLPVLGVQSGMFGHFAGRENEFQSAFGWKESDNQWLVEKPANSSLRVNESGYMNEYNLGFGLNISHFLFMGASLSVTDIDYKYSSFYEDAFRYNTEKDDYLYMENRLNTKGTAVSANIGVIMNLEMIRLGVAYNSPRLYDMTDYYRAWAGTEIHGYDEPKWEAATPDGAYSEYRFKTPDKWIFSGAFVFGQSALVSADYEIMNYRNMRFSDRNGDADYEANDYIKDDYTFLHTLKLGAEIKVTPQFAIRGGYMMQTSPMREALVENQVEVLPAGTIPHFTVTSKPTNYVTAGLGYRFTPNFYMDLACVYRTNDSDAYAFSNTYSSRASADVVSKAAKLKTKKTRIALTFGYKF